MFMLAMIVVALVVYGLGPNFDGAIAKELVIKVKEKLIKLLS